MRFPAKPKQIGPRCLTARSALGTGHLSLYQLTIEPGTRFATHGRAARFRAARCRQRRGFVRADRRMTAAAGLPAYEISNHARPGEESRHNLTYWRYGDYAGIGPGAHGRRLGQRTVRHRKPENFLAASLAMATGSPKKTPLPPVRPGTRRWLWACASRGDRCGSSRATLRAGLDCRLGTGRTAGRVRPFDARRRGDCDNGEGPVAARPDPGRNRFGSLVFRGLLRRGQPVSVQAW